MYFGSNGKCLKPTGVDFEFMNTNGFSKILIIGIIAVVVVIAVVVPIYSIIVRKMAKPHPLPVAVPWHIYRNESFGFEVQYPPEWKIEFEDYGRAASNFSFAGPEVNGAVEKFLIQVATTDARNLAEWVESDISSRQQYKIRDVEFGIYPGILVDIQSAHPLEPQS